uniref:Uncharacterized protein n=1 Tax=Oryza brachyantha TaxID=4533 RepID=J3MP63_ORYBR
KRAFRGIPWAVRTGRRPAAAGEVPRCSPGSAFTPLLFLFWFGCRLRPAAEMFFGRAANFFSRSLGHRLQIDRDTGYC